MTATGRHDLNLFRKVIEVNLIGTLNVRAIASEAIAATEAVDGGSRGVIVNTASKGRLARRSGWFSAFYRPGSVPSGKTRFETHCQMPPPLRCRTRA